MKTELTRIQPFFAICLAGTLLMASGCLSDDAEIPQPLPAAVANVSVVTKDRATLKKAVVVAATHRRWLPSEISPNVIRCTLLQRKHKVEIDITLTGDKSYSISCLFSNIPERKYQQWISNLQREIAKQAASL